jgi:hypothetical protein
MRRLVRATMLVCLLAPVRARAEPETSWRDYLTFTLSERVRGEFVDWFGPPPGTAAAGAERYDFFASQFRAGVKVLLPHVQLTLEMQDTELANVPEDASLAPPQGNLGPGANYFANTRQNPQGEPFLKLGHLTLRGAGITATLGRFEYRDGLETVPADPTLAFLKRTRIAERLVGPFDFTHVTRSFDGGQVAWNSPVWNVTAWGARPTQGGFEVSANTDVGDVWLSGLTATLKRLAGAPPLDARLFYLFYRDARDDVVKVDNRPLAVRETDHDPIGVHTVGTHALGSFDAGPGAFDVLVWGALQVGEWGTQNHAAWAWALEGGYQLPRLPAAPWLRIGYDRASGDDDPADHTHGTFFQVTPTARIYAQLPFYNLMNSADLFLELILRPHERVFVRTDWHCLEVTEGRDLWYQGGGVTNRTLFGYGGAPANGDHQLAQLVDVSVTVTLLRRLTLGTYYGHAFGRDVVGQSFRGRDADYGFVELAFRY